jgi:hypothetical protein
MAAYWNTQITVPPRLLIEALCAEEAPVSATYTEATAEAGRAGSR